MALSEPITVCITRTVKPGRERDFERALHDFVHRSFTLLGQNGVHVMRPAPGDGSRQYGIVRKFANRDALIAFRESPVYLEWTKTALELTEGDARAEELGGLESWFTLPQAALRPLPKWKMAIATFLGVFPVVMALNPTLGTVIHSWHVVPRNVVFVACAVCLLTWVVMSFITRLLHPWLRPEEKKS